MSRGLTLLFGAGLGAGLMYLLDPDKGNRRRALLGDQVTHLTHVTRETANDWQIQLKNRMQGLKAETRAQLTQVPASDATLEARVRAHLGHIVSHPSAIQVESSKGYITLSGPVLASEADTLIEEVGLIPGVQGVRNNLQMHQTADSVPGLQGSGAPS